MSMTRDNDGLSQILCTVHRINRETHLLTIVGAVKVRFLLPGRLRGGLMMDALSSHMRRIVYLGLFFIVETTVPMV